MNHEVHSRKIQAAYIPDTCKISDFEYFKDGFGVILDAEGNILQKYIQAIYNPKTKQYEVASYLLPKVYTFMWKKNAVAAAKRMGIPANQVKPFGNRYQRLWGICIDKEHPDCFISVFEQFHNLT